MIPKFRYWNSFLQKMMKVTIIDLKNGILNATILGDEIYAVEFKNRYLMQSNGIFDKNGTEIFEGDIIKMQFPLDRRCIGRFVVVRDTDSPRLGIVDNQLSTEIFNLYKYKSEYYEVVGNKYDNQLHKEEK